MKIPLTEDGRPMRKCEDGWADPDCVACHGTGYVGYGSEQEACDCFTSIGEAVHAWASARLGTGLPPADSGLRFEGWPDVVVKDRATARACECFLDSRDTRREEEP